MKIRSDFVSNSSSSSFSIPAEEVNLINELLQIRDSDPLKLQSLLEEAKKNYFGFSEVLKFYEKSPKIQRQKQ